MHLLTISSDLMYYAEYSLDEHLLTSISTPFYHLSSSEFSGITAFNEVIATSI